MAEAATLAAPFLPLQTGFYPQQPESGQAGQTYLRAEILPVDQPLSARPVEPLSPLEPIQKNLVYNRQGRLESLPTSRYSWYA